MVMNGTISDSWMNDSCNVYNNATRVKYPFNYHMDLKLFRIMFYSVICLLGTTGNGLVIWFCLFKMKKTVNVIWFLNVALADFTFALGVPFITAQTVLDGHWPFGDFMCRFVWFLFFFNMSTSVLQLSIISVDRCICVVFPVWSHNHRSKKLALIVVQILWVFSIASNLPSYIFRSTVGVCKIFCVFKVELIWIPTMSFFFYFLIPFIVIISCYTVIVLRLKEKNLMKSSKTFKIIIAVVMAFFICWFPYHLFDLIKLHGPKDVSYAHVIVRQVTKDLRLFNCCINPILYVFIGQDFKQRFCGSFQAIFEIMEDTDMLNFKTHEQHGIPGIMLL